MRWFYNHLANPLVALLLRSPLHVLANRWLLLVTVAGRRSGRLLTLPVQYDRRDGAVMIVSTPDRTWWRNLVGGATASVRLGADTFVVVGTAHRGQSADAARASLDGTSLTSAARRITGAVVIELRELNPA